MASAGPSLAVRHVDVRALKEHRSRPCRRRVALLVGPLASCLSIRHSSSNDRVLLPSPSLSQLLFPHPLRVPRQDARLFSHRSALPLSSQARPPPLPRANSACPVRRFRSVWHAPRGIHVAGHGEAECSLGAGEECVNGGVASGVGGGGPGGGEEGREDGEVGVLVAWGMYSGEGGGGRGGTGGRKRGKEAKNGGRNAWRPLMMDHRFFLL